MRIIALILCVFGAQFLAAQPVSGYMGKRVLSSIEMEILPGLNPYETNQSSFLTFGLVGDGMRSYVPRVYLNTEYQLTRKIILSGALGYARMQVPLNMEYIDENYAFPMSTYIFQIRLKQGANKVAMVTSSSYIAYGIGLYFSNAQDAPLLDVGSLGYPPISLGSTDVNAFNFALNFEFGRRIVFKPGLVVDFGIVTNLSSGLLKTITSNQGFYYIVDEEYLNNQMQFRTAINSLFNFKIAVGLFY